MKQWKCVECGHIVIGGDDRPTLNWDDGHVCVFEEDNQSQEIIFYCGRRLARGAQVFRVVVTPEREYETPLQHFELHSPDGFEWGYMGSGPADLALAILCDYFGEAPTRAQLNIRQSKAQQIYQKFKGALIAKLPRGNHWQFNQEDITNWLASDEKLLKRLQAYEDLQRDLDEEVGG